MEKWNWSSVRTQFYAGNILTLRQSGSSTWQKIPKKKMIWGDKMKNSKFEIQKLLLVIRKSPWRRLFLRDWRKSYPRPNNLGIQHPIQDLTQVDNFFPGHQVAFKSWNMNHSTQNRKLNRTVKTSEKNQFFL